MTNLSYLPDNTTLRVGDVFQHGFTMSDNSICWGSIQTVKRVGDDGSIIFRAKFGKVDKVAEYVRLPMAAQTEENG